MTDLLKPETVHDAATWGLIAGFIALGVLWGVYFFASKRKDYADPAMTQFWEGADGRVSFSKFQLWLWTMVIGFTLVWVWVERMILAGGVVSPINDIPENILGILGISAGTTLAAKAVTTAQVRDGVLPRTKLEARAGESRFRYLLADDEGNPELSKLQMFLFTGLSVAFFIMTVANNAFDVRELNDLKLPDIDSTMLVLMGVSASGYLGKKFVTRAAPEIKDILPASYPSTSPGSLRIVGANLGDATVGVLSVGSVLYDRPNNPPTPVLEWTNDHITLDRALLGLAAGHYPVIVSVYNAASQTRAFDVT